MHTSKDYPWMGYLKRESDGKRIISEDAPEKIKKKYYEYLKANEEIIKKGGRIRK